MTAEPLLLSPWRDLHWMSNPGLWITWPFLPLTRRHAVDDMHLGMLIDTAALSSLTGFRCTVFRSLCGDPHKGGYADLSIMRS